MKLRTLLFTSIGLAAPLITLATDTTQVLNPPFGTTTTVGAQEPVAIFGAIIQVLLGVVGAVTLLMFIWGGFRIIFAGGKEEEIGHGKKTLLWAVIGLAVVLSSYAILQYTFAILKNTANATSTTTTTTAMLIPTTTPSFKV